MRRSRTVYFLFGVVLLLLFATAEVFVSKQWSHMLDDQHRRTALKEELLRLRQLASAIDNGFRGYVLMQRTPYLEPMLSAEREIPPALERLSRLVDSDPALEGRVEVLKRRLEELAETKRQLAVKVAAGKHDEVLSYVRSGDGVALSKILAAAFEDLEGKVDRQSPATELSQLEMQRKILWQLAVVQTGTVFLGVLLVRSLLDSFAFSARREPRATADVG